MFDWATDFTEDDNSIWGGKFPKIILFKNNKNKAVYAYYNEGPDDKRKLGATFVTMYPSVYSWHLDYYSEEDTETGDYKLVRLGKGNKTRLDWFSKTNVRSEEKRLLWRISKKRLNFSGKNTTSLYRKITIRARKQELDLNKIFPRTYSRL